MKVYGPDPKLMWNFAKRELQSTRLWKDVVKISILCKRRPSGFANDTHYGQIFFIYQKNSNYIPSFTNNKSVDLVFWYVQSFFLPKISAISGDLVDQTKWELTKEREYPSKKYQYSNLVFNIWIEYT